MISDKILIAIPNLTAFYAIEKDLIEIKKKVSVDIVIIEAFNTQIRKLIENVLNGKGHKTKSLNDAKKESYKIYLEPYPLVNDIDAEFRIRYEYGVTPSYAKPDPVYSPEWNLFYDAVICYSHIAANILSAITRPCIVKPTQFDNFIPHKKTNKTNLLILFTWGDVSATKMLFELKKQLGEEYNIIIKAHHGVEYLPEHKDALKILQKVADEYHDAATNVNQLFNKADIVLSDNSSVVFTAIYLGIPAAIFTKAKSDYYNLNGIKSAHFSLLIEPKLIPYTDNIKEIKLIIESAPKNIKHQNKLKTDFYPSDIKTTLLDVVENYLKRDRKKDPYYILRDLLLSKKLVAENTIAEQTRLIDDLKNENKLLKNNIEELNKQIEELNKRVESYLGIRRSSRLLGGNIKRKIGRIMRNT